MKDFRPHARRYLGSIVGHEDPVDHVARWFAEVRWQAIEECARIAEDPGFIDARDSEWDEGVNFAKRYIADAIRRLQVAE